MAGSSLSTRIQASDRWPAGGPRETPSASPGRQGTQGEWRRARKEGRSGPASLVKDDASSWTHQAPPQCISVGVKMIVLALLRQVHQKRGQDEAQEADVPGGDQLLKGTGVSGHLASVRHDPPPATRPRA